MRTETGQSFRLEDYKPAPYTIVETEMVFRLLPENTTVVTTVIIERRDNTSQTEPLVLDGDSLQFEGLLIDGTPAHDSGFTVSPDHLEILELPKEKRFQLQIKTRLSPEENTALMGLYRSNGVYCTQCEAEGFRRITYFLDRPDVLSTYKVRIEARKSEAPILLSNGNPGSSGDIAEGWHFAEWHDPHPKPSYLFALVAGNLGFIEEDFSTSSGKPVKLRIYVEPGKESRAGYAMDSLIRSMRWDEEVFGCEYDLDVFNIVAVSDFNMGAMENKGLNIFNDKYVLADAETATDADFASIETIVAHEYFHNWTGNRITCRDWFQLCLKEGLTVYRDHEFSADQRSRAVKRISEVRVLKANQFPEDRGPLAHSVRPKRYKEISNFYTATVYEKGSEVVRMLRTILGPEIFRKAMDHYFAEYDGTAATIEQFIRCFETVSGANLKQFFLWYEQAGTPSVSVSRRYNPAKKTLTLDIVQSIPPTPGQSRKKPMHIPIAYGLVGAKGADLQHGKVVGADVTGGVIHLKERQQRVVFHDVNERPAVSFLRGFSAPVNLDFEQSGEHESLLARHDSDPFARWQMINNLIVRALVQATGTIRDDLSIEFDPVLIELMGDLASDDKLEHAYRGLALSVPTESEIAREIGENIDPDAILSARREMLRQIAAGNSARFAKLFDDLSDNEPFSPDAENAGRRSLKNILLAYLAYAEDSPNRSFKAFDTATNMTDLAAAIAVLVHTFPGSDETASALESFETRFRKDPIVMDKWFAVQATTPGAFGLENVRSLMTHSAYSSSNPNRFRALIGSFAAANHTGFNSADGKGYELVAGEILRIDKINPQIAARLATSFRSFSGLEPVRREAARHAVVRISQGEDLSADLRDIVERLLA